MFDFLIFLFRDLFLIKIQLLVELLDVTFLVCCSSMNNFFLFLFIFFLL